MPKYVYVDKKCIGCQTCVRTVPTLFYFDSVHKKAKCIIEKDCEFPIEDETKLQEALDACPIDAIAVIEK